MPGMVANNGRTGERQIEYFFQRTCFTAKTNSPTGREDASKPDYLWRQSARREKAAVRFTCNATWADASAILVDS